MRKIIVMLALIFFFQLVCFAADGDLDPSFNPTGAGGVPAGTAITNFGGVSNSQAQAIAIQADDKIVAAGFSDFGGNNNFALARYNTNSSLDTSFNPTGAGGVPAGMVITSFGGGSTDVVSALAIQADGKIVAAGSSNSGTTNFALARYNSDGSLDTSFNSTGLVTTSFGGGSNNQILAVALQTDGKIVVAGVSDFGGTTNFALARYNSSGSLDTSFNPTGAGGVPAGTVITNFGGMSNDQAQAIAIQADGKIIAVGVSDFGGNINFALARYTTNGSLDTSFNPTGAGGVPPGTVITNFGGASVDEATAVVLQPDGKIIAAGCANMGGNDNIALARYNTNGSLDSATFNPTGAGGVPPGTVVTDLGGVSDEVTSVVLQPNGKIVVAGFSNFGGIDNFCLARYNTNGSLDTSFNPTGAGGVPPGTVITNFGGASVDQALAMALQADGKIVAAGFSNVSGNNNFALARYQNSSPLTQTTITFPTNNSITNNNQPTITGIAQNPSTITLFINGIEQLPGTVTLDALNQWSYTPVAPLADGVYTLVAVSDYTSGRVNLASTAITFTINTVAPPTPIIIIPANGSTITTNTPVIAGRSTGDAIAVDIAIDGLLVASNIPVLSKNWSYALTASQALSDGLHQVSVVAHDATGNTSAPAISNFTVSTVVPPIIPAPPVIAQPTNGSIVNTRMLAIAGTADSNSVAVQLFINSDPIIVTVPIVNGTWAYTLTPAQALSEGLHSVIAVAISSAGVVSAPSNRVVFEVLTSRLSCLSIAIRAKYCPRG